MYGKLCRFEVYGHQNLCVFLGTPIFLGFEWLLTLDVVPQVVQHILALMAALNHTLCGSVVCIVGLVSVVQQLLSSLSSSRYYKSKIPITNTEAN